MDFNSNASINQGQVVSGGSGGRGGGGLAIGGVGGLVVMLLAMLFGINPGDILGQDAGAGAGEATPAQCRTGADVQSNPDCRWPAYVTSINDFWATQMQGYRPAQTKVYSTGSVATGCGTASREVGPFYCPPDERVYIDTQFADALLKQLGAQGGYAAEAYIVAHEYGHHISNLTGQMNQAQSGGQQTGPASPGVRLELQADCYAGVWFKHVTKDPNNIIQNVTQDDLDRVVDAAAAVGDDRIQKSQSGRVSPEQWTHGSAAMRQRWVATGFASGNPNSCDTFSVPASQLGG